MSVSIRDHVRRRRALMDLMEPDSIAVVAASQIRVRNATTEYPFRQDSDFYYLTGFDEPGAVLVLVPGRDHGEVLLFCEERDPQFERWVGARLGPEAAPQALGVDDAFPLPDLDDILPGLLEGRRRLYYGLGPNPAFDDRMLGWIRSIKAGIERGGHPPGEMVNLAHPLHELRLHKSAGEIALMRNAAQITADAHCRAMRFCQPGQHEWQLEAELLHEFMRQGARHPAYPSIVAAGANACVLHYTRNDARIRAGDLVLIDAGCEYQYYAADVTRTFPASGRFSGPQRAVYEIVLAAQQAAIETMRAGVEFDLPHRTAERVIAAGLIELGVLSGTVDDVMVQQSHKPYTVHRTSHWLGLDVHDVGDYRIDDVWRVLEPGMVLTIEPGIYLAPDAPGVPAELAGIGIRIEDDVHITRGAPDVLSEAVPRAIEEVEALTRESQAAVERDAG